MKYYLYIYVSLHKDMDYQLWSDNNFDRVNKLIKKLMKTDIYEMCNKREEDIEELIQVCNIKCV